MNLKPSSKTWATTIAAAVVAVATVVFDQFGYHVAAGVGAPAVAVLSIAIAYFVPAKSGKYVAGLITDVGDAFDDDEVTDSELDDEDGNPLDGPDWTDSNDEPDEGNKPKRDSHGRFAKA